jgi:hypothetical protein
VRWAFNWAMPFFFAKLGLTVNMTFGASIVFGFLSGVLTSGAFQITSNLLFGNQWDLGLGSALLSGGIIGGIAGGLGFKIRQWIGSGDLEKYLFQVLSKKKGAGDLVIIGNFPKYLTTAQKLNAKAFDIPPKTWSWLKNMGVSWPVNESYLANSVLNGDVFYLATPFKTGWNQLVSGFKSELIYLLSEGLDIFTRLSTEWLVLVSIK